jgi:hypothetical protein
MRCFRPFSHSHVIRLSPPFSVSLFLVDLLLRLECMAVVQLVRFSDGASMKFCYLVSQLTIVGLLFETLKLLLGFSAPTYL